MGFAVLADHRVEIRESKGKIKKKTIKKILGSCQRTKKAVAHEGDGDINCSRCAWNGLQRLGKGTGGIENQRTNQDHPDHEVVGID